MTARTFLDTNVLVYLFDSDEPVKQQRAREVLADHAARDFVISTQVVGEFYVCITRKLRRALSLVDAADAVSNLCELTVVATDAALVQRAVHTSQTKQVSYWDALIIEAASSAGCGRILTEDLAAGTEIRGVRVEDPFAA